MPILSLLRTQHRPTTVLQRLAARYQHLAGIRRSRIDLSRLDDHLLADIGLSRHDAETEAIRPAWDAPLHWRG